ncbi:MAG: hypothetical protein CBB69_008920 [Phycisphaera sp. TMED9]|nr:MAG: hypothetical protein CBB69_008920 [Phycisphaera sp. TMED9]
MVGMGFASWRGTRNLPRRTSMQIGPSNPELLSPAGLSKVLGTASNTVRPVEATPPTEAPPTAAGTQILDMDAFMSAWGSEDQTWDVDGSGTVDGIDLGQLLAAQTAAQSGDAELQGLLGAWGSADPDWDFNADGVVDGQDLGIYLDGGIPADSDASEAMTVEGFMEAWGSADPMYDLNGDGTVDGQDLGQYLEQQMESTADPSLLDQFMSAWGSDNQEFDFNGDGIVDGIDLGIMLEQAEGTQLPATELPGSGSKVEAIVNRLANYAMSRLDPNGDGFVPLDSLDIKDAAKAQFDLDGDGHLSRSEMFSMIAAEAKRVMDGEGGNLADFAARWESLFDNGQDNGE